MKLRSLLAGMTFGCCAVQADVIGLRLGLDYLDLNPELQVGDSGFMTPFVQDERRHEVLTGRFEHPLPLVPEVALRYQSHYLQGQQWLTKPAQLGGRFFAASQSVAQQTQLTQLDLTAYYEILDNPLISVDAGMTVRQLRADTSWQTSSQQAQAELAVLSPMLYLDSQFAIWGTDTFLYCGGHYTRYQGDLSYDWQIGAAWRVIDIAMFQLLLKAGWQTAKQRITNRDKQDLSTGYSSALVGVVVDF